VIAISISENLIGMLDQIDGDETLEDVGDLEPSRGWTDRGPSALANNLQDDREDEHGGDIQDEPHDEEPDDEPNGDDTDYDGGECGWRWGGRRQAGDTRLQLKGCKFAPFDPPSIPVAGFALLAPELAPDGEGRGDMRRDRLTGGCRNFVGNPGFSGRGGTADYHCRHVSRPVP
jgi:hypothetical protein